MKLETTLDERPGFLHALPLFDLFALVTMLLLLGPMFLSQSGIGVEVPASRFQMQRYSKTIVVTVGPGGREASLYLGRQAVSLDDLAGRLAGLKQDEGMSRAIVLLKTDVGTAVGMERLVSEIILGSGFELALVGRPSRETEVPIAPAEEGE
jgi:biopolymer transport protein ExbD